MSSKSFLPFLVISLLILSVLSGSIITPTSAANPYAAEISGLERYITNLYNPDIGLVAVGTQMSCNGACHGVRFYFKNGTAAPILPEWQRYLPLENWMDASAFMGLDFDTEVAQTIYNSIESLGTSVGWHAPWNREAMVGVITDYGIRNTNIVFTTSSGGYPLMPSSGLPYQIEQAAPWDTVTQSWAAPDMNINDATRVNQNNIEETMFQAMNLYLRGDKIDAMANLQWVASLAVNHDGAIGFGTPPFLGIDLGTFLECVYVIGMPTLPSGITLDGIITTLWTLQSTQTDGGIPAQYSSFTSGVLGSDDEATNAALLAFSPGVISYIKGVEASGVYNTQTLPSADPQIGNIQPSQSSSSSATLSSSTTTSQTSEQLPSVNVLYIAEAAAVLAVIGIIALVVRARSQKAKE